jgi:hypothetical protein
VIAIFPVFVVAKLEAVSVLLPALLKVMFPMLSPVAVTAASVEAPACPAPVKVTPTLPTVDVPPAVIAPMTT